MDLVSTGSLPDTSLHQACLRRDYIAVRKILEMYTRGDDAVMNEVGRCAQDRSTPSTRTPSTRTPSTSEGTQNYLLSPAATASTAANVLPEYLCPSGSFCPEKLTVTLEMPKWGRRNGTCGETESNHFRNFSFDEEQQKWLDEILSTLVDPTGFGDASKSETARKMYEQARDHNRNVISQMERDFPQYSGTFAKNAYFLQSLRPKKWLVDAVVDGYASILYESAVENSKFYIFKTTSHQDTREGYENDDMNNPSIVDWPLHYAEISKRKRNAVYLRDKSYLIFHVCASSHFILLIFNIETWELLILDSLNEIGSFRNTQEEAAKVVIKIVENVFHMRAYQQRKDIPVKCYALVDIPQQPNDDGNCGVFLSMFLDAFLQGLDLTKIKWSTSDADEFRKRMALALVDKM